MAIDLVSTNLSFYLADLALRRVGKGLILLLVIPLLPGWWGCRRDRLWWLKRRRKLARSRVKYKDFDISGARLFPLRRSV
jgi:hypothetical protein